MTGAENALSATRPPVIRDYAHKYAAKGLRLIPAEPNSKRPSVANWPTVATSDIDTIDKWFTGHRNIGIALGEWDGDGWLVAIDIDTKHGDGYTELRELTDQHGALPTTWEQVTASGGCHLIFRSSTEIRNSAKRLAPNIDVRGQGGQIIAAPSQIGDRAYRWVEGRAPWERPIADLPDWLHQKLVALTEPPATPPSKHGDPFLTSTHHDSPLDRLRDRWDWATELTKDGWQHTHQRGQDSYWTRPGKNTQDGHSAVLHGNDCFVVFTTELTDAQLRTGADTRSGTISFSPAQWLAARTHNGNMSALAHHLKATETPLETPTSNDTDNGYRNPMYDTLIDFRTLGEQPEAVIEGLLFPGRWTFLYAPKKQGKSTLMVGLSLAIAKGHDPIADTPTRPRFVLYYDAEMGRLDLSQRLDDFGQPPETIHQDLPNWKADDTRRPLNDPREAANILNLVDDLGIEVVILDGINGFIAGDENSNHEWVELFNHCIAPLKKRGVAIISNDNSGKDPAKGARGGSAKSDKADAIILLTRQDGTGYRLQRKFTRTNAYTEKIDLFADNIDTNEPMRIRPAQGRQWPRGTADAAAAMDDLNIPTDLATRKIAALLREAGHQFRTATINAAIQYRRQANHDLGDLL